MKITQESAEQMLNNIFTIVGHLYNEMCLNPKNGGNHSMVYNLFSELGRTIANADRASFWRWDKSAKKLITTAATGIAEIIIDDSTGLVGKSLKENRPIVTNDPYNHPDFNSAVDKKTGYVTKSILVMPVSNCRGEVIGAFQVINKLDDQGFNEVEDTKRLSIAALICGMALESDIFFDESQHDKLTGLKNRFGFYNDYKSKYKPLLQENLLSLIICDIDFFKKVNDVYGHNAGDAVLKHVADILKIKANGVFRWGGEEFIIILEQMNIDSTAKFADDVREAVESSVCKFEDTDINVTMSFGCTEIDSKLTIEENIQIADERLYQAKKTGRNKVVKG